MLAVLNGGLQNRAKNAYHIYLVAGLQQAKQISKEMSWDDYHWSTGLLAFTVLVVQYTAYIQS